MIYLIGIRKTLVEIMPSGFRNRSECFTYVIFALVAGLMRLWDLGSRAMHHDESLHAWFAWNLSIGNGYTQNPMMHGPFQMEGQAALFFLLGDSEFTSRLLYAIAGTVLVIMPIFLRQRLGRMGAIFVSGMFVFSPTLLYFSRFARNDILMAVWTFGLVICLWRYLDEGKQRYLLIGSALLALMFATKESAYLVTFILGQYLAFILVVGVYKRLRGSMDSNSNVKTLSVTGAIGKIWFAFRDVYSSDRSPKGGFVRQKDFFVFLLSLSLPLGASLFGILQNTILLNWSGIVLINDDWSIGAVGAPLKGGLVIASVIVVVLVWSSWIIGSRMMGSAWWKYASIFYVMFVLFYSTFLTNMAGVGSGIWQSLGYWLVQQGEARGDQPFYYYLIIAPLYEFLPFFIAIAGTVYYSRKNDEFGRFLVYWAWVTLIIYTIASEKMPWLLVNITVPLIVLAGKYIGELIGEIHFPRVVTRDWLLVGITVFLCPIVFWWSVYTPLFQGDVGFVVNVFLSLIFLVLLFFTIKICLHMGRSYALYLVPAFGIPVLIVMSVQTGWTVTYKHGDVPVEMMVYTQTSPDIARLARYISNEVSLNEQTKRLSVTVDGTHGFHWPWWWYLRNKSEVTYLNYEESSTAKPPKTDILIIHSKHHDKMKEMLDGDFREGERIKHRWWFPENYKGLSFNNFLRGIAKPEVWNEIIDYVLYRELEWNLGSEDSYVYFSKDSKLEFEAS